MNEKILIVDDEKDICDLIELNLLSNGFKEIKTAYDGKSAVKIVREWLPDLILLDLMLPEIDGIQICRLLKNDDSLKNIPIIMLTAKSSEYDIVSGLECGADDYITKPFSNKILLERIKAQLRKVNREKTIIYKNLVINTVLHTAKLNNKILELTYSEFEILSSLASYPKRVYTRSELISMLRGDDGYDITERAIDVQIVNLRRKLGEFGGDYIKTVRGVGYKLGRDE